MSSSCLALLSLDTLRNIPLGKAQRVHCWTANINKSVWSSLVHSPQTQVFFVKCNLCCARPSFCNTVCFSSGGYFRSYPCVCFYSVTLEAKSGVVTIVGMASERLKLSFVISKLLNPFWKWDLATFASLGRSIVWVSTNQLVSASVWQTPQKERRWAKTFAKLEMVQKGIKQTIEKASGENKKSKTKQKRQLIGKFAELSVAAWS